MTSLQPETQNTTEGGRRVLFLRFASTFGLMAVLLLGGMAVLALLLIRAVNGPQMSTPVWLAGAVLALGLPLLAGWLAVAAYQRLTQPLGDAIAAANAMTKGDMNTHVPEEDSGELAALAVAMNQLASELQRANVQRRNLTAEVVHQLRAAIQTMQHSLQELLDGGKKGSADDTRKMLEETRRLAWLVEDFHTLSLAEAGELNLELTQVDIPALLTAVHDSFLSEAKEKKIRLSVVVNSSREGLRLRADQKRLTQILNTLVANALSHTPDEGFITLQAESSREEVHITIKDTGEGIPPEDLPHVFDRFWHGEAKLDSGPTRGLGLAIAKYAVEAHRGRIEVESQVGKSTVFMIHLPRM